MQVVDESEADDDVRDWLEDSEDGDESFMTAREIEKVQKTLYDQGYREGITAGKESNLQKAFDQGFANIGAPIGRKAGIIVGKVKAASLSLTFVQDKSAFPSLESRIKAIRQRCITNFHLLNLNEPDYEAAEHEREHDESIPQIIRETPAEKQARELILTNLESDVNQLLLDIKAHHVTS